eukprot:gene55932-76675_t
MRENIQRERRQELQELAQLLRHKASTDALTGLFNRMRFNEGLASEMASAHEAAARLVSAIKVSDFDIVGTITCSFGVTEYCPGESAEILIARADNALYRAKMNGRNRVEIARRPDVATSSLALTG